MIIENYLEIKSYMLENRHLSIHYMETLSTYGKSQD